MLLSLYLECEVYTEEQLRPKAQRLSKDYIADIERRYANEEGDPEEVEDSESEDDDDDCALDMHSFGDTGAPINTDRNIRKVRTQKTVDTEE